MKNYLVIEHGPFAGFTPTDFRSWLSEHTQETDIAAAMKYVHEKTEILGAHLDFISDKWLDYAYEEWYELEIVLVDQIKDFLARDNKLNCTNYPLEDKGWHFIIEPFVERNGYRNGSGWWIEKDEDYVSTDRINQE